ncbi:cytochrome P450 [Methyloceanibacter sp.]|uniref:cytochrome P450 n=1 Tax=Methyloceanibacter sp. TaxID=1965321 RepID=UPI002D1C7D7A|nr:cytochrome P450 [Methyloceanibacter sp.]HML92325.1 cytochrome P450 [Methyloceanibacter sp.]
MTVAYSPIHGLGEEQSIWFKLTPLLARENPMQILMSLSERYGGIIPINLKNQRILLLSEPAHAEHMLVSNFDNYAKYLEGLRPVFGRSMITVDGALWQKLRMPQQAAFHPQMFEVYFPYLMSAIESKMARWAQVAASGETIEMVEETWTLAAEMVCKALFDREMPFNPHFVFKQVKTYTDVVNHKSIRLKHVRGELVEITDEDAAKAMKVWGSIPEMVLGADTVDNRKDTLLGLLEKAEADPNFPEFDHGQVIDEMKQYLWAGTETTALTLAWCLYLLSQHPEAMERIRAEVRSVCGDADPEWNQVQQLSYTRMVIQETMRMFPPVWALIRIAKEDDEIEGHKVRAGDKVVMLTYVAHHNPKYWDEPERFDPERFAPERAKKRVKYSYLPFAAGKRSCIGGALSQIENMLAVAQLLRRFTPEFAGTVPANIHATVTLCPKGGLPFRIRELK